MRSIEAVCITEVQAQFHRYVSSALSCIFAGGQPSHGGPHRGRGLIQLPGSLLPTLSGTHRAARRRRHARNFGPCTTGNLEVVTRPAVPSHRDHVLVCRADLRSSVASRTPDPRGTRAGASGLPAPGDDRLMTPVLLLLSPPSVRYAAPWPASRPCRYPLVNPR